MAGRRPGLRGTANALQGGSTPPPAAIYRMVEEIMQQKKHLIFAESDIRERRYAANIALFGGMDRLRKHYIGEAEKCGINLKVFSNAMSNIGAKIQNLDAVVIFTNKVSHNAKNEVIQVAKARRIPVLMCHSCGICSWRECIECLINKSFSSAAL